MSWSGIGNAWRARRLGGLGAVALFLLVCAGVAHAAMLAIADQAARPARIARAPLVPRVLAPPYIPDPTAAPSAGTTGTIALPDLPVPPVDASAGIDGTIHPAQPFSMARASATDRGRALDCLTTAIYYEAASEPDAGQQAVAQVILNRVRHPAFPSTVCGVVYQGSERATGCQFSFACDGSMARVPAAAYWARAMRVAAAALAGRVFAPVGLATHYHTYAVTPAWNRDLVMTAAIGAHFFHRWQGYWGTAAAFHQIYAGGEPRPGPHAKLAPPPVAPLILASVAPIPMAAVTAPTLIQPAYAASGEVREAAPAAASDGLPESTILDKWKDTGTPLR